MEMISSMFLRLYSGLLRLCATQVRLQRTVFIVGSAKRRITKSKKENFQRWAEREDMKVEHRKQAGLTEGMNELQKLKSSVADYRSTRHTGDSNTISNQSLSKCIHIEDQTLNEGALTREGLNYDGMAEFDPKRSSLLSHAVEIPLIFRKKLGPAVKYLVTKEHQNWHIALQQIEDSGGFKDICELDIRKLVYSIPKFQLILVFSQIERLLQEAGLQKSPKVVNAYLKGLIAGGTMSDDRVELMEHYVAYLRLLTKKQTLSRETYEILIEAYGKSRRIRKMESVIHEMKSCGLKPSLNVYKSVLNTCVYKTRDHKQAVQLFDLMKFLAGAMAPGVIQYQDVIVSYVNNGDIERALDLYEEMQGRGINVNQKILVALAKGCMTRKHLKLKAWDFIFEIYKREWEPTVPTLEYMVYLAAKDGDLSLSRALYQHLNILGAASARSFGFLMLAYANSGLAKDLDKYNVPSVSVHESGRNFRRNILERADFTPEFCSPKRAIPFLPLSSLADLRELLSESNAVMAHTLLLNQELLSDTSMNRFLEISAKLGSMDEFIEQYDHFTFFDSAGAPGTRDIVSEKGLFNNHEHGLVLETKTEISAPRASDNTKISVLKLDKMYQYGTRFPRSTYTYCIALRAAARHKNYAFSQMVWRERGSYRQSASFRSMTANEKKESDFNFAATMVKCLTDMALLNDALAILVSTEYQFKWTWKELKPLHTAAVNLGHEKVTKTVRGVANRAQEKFEGKIRRKDYKEYVSERGY